MKLIDLYYEWKKAKEIPEAGLCNSVPTEYRETLELFEPIKPLPPNKSEVFWASNLASWDWRRFSEFTPLRQAIVLSICAIHGEL
jgi:hypothetical protein